jgi:hypothetical protein
MSTGNLSASKGCKYVHSRIVRGATAALPEGTPDTASRCPRTAARSPPQTRTRARAEKTRENTTQDNGSRQQKWQHEEYLGHEEGIPALAALTNTIAAGVSADWRQ